MEEKNFDFGNSEKSEKVNDKDLKREHLRAERYKRQAAEKRDKLRKKAEIKEQRALIKKERKRLKEERKKQRENRTDVKNGRVAAVITLSISTAVLALALVYTTLVPTASDRRLEDGYRKSFYDTVVQVDNMDLNLSKALATKDGGAIMLYLTDLAVNSELAENNLQQLPIEDENKFYTTKIINQVGDYAKYLNKKLITGEKLSASDYENLKQLYKANAALKNALAATMKDMDGDFDFADMGSIENNTLLQNFNELQELSVEYPELIYDGPFSDGKVGETVKGLSGREITEAEAEKIFAEKFKNYAPENIRSTGKSTGEIEAFAIEAEIKGDIAYAQISVVGGKTVMYSYAGSCNAINYNDDAATETALNFIKSEGMFNMKPVWINLTNNVYTINFAPEEGGAVIYPDLVKVRVCAETDMVIGMEATGYYKNHVERDIPSPVLSISEARQSVSDDIKTETVRLAIVPFGENSERLCYEFSGTLDGETYYVYIDAETGRQVEMFKVINSEQGTLLM